MDQKEMIRLIFDAIEEMNEYLPDEEQLEMSSETVLFGEEARLDSIGLVDLIVAIEQRIDDALGVSVALADEKAVSLDNSPYRTVKTLANYASKVLNAQER